MNKDSSKGRKRDVPLAIIGISCIFPEADGLDAYWHNIRNGVDAITEVPGTHWSPDSYFDADPKAPDMTYASRGGFIPEIDFNPLDFGIAPNALEATDTAQLLGLYTASRALDDAGYGSDREFDRDRVSVVLGVTGTLAGHEDVFASNKVVLTGPGVGSPQCAAPATVPPHLLPRSFLFYVVLGPHFLRKKVPNGRPLGTLSPPKSPQNPQKSSHQ